MRLAESKKRKVSLVILTGFGQLEVESLREHRSDHLENHLRKRLSEANALASIEWQPAGLGALLAIGCQGVRVITVETVRIESSRVLPVLRAVVHRVGIDQEWVVGFDMNSTHLCILLVVVGCAPGSRRVVAKGLVKDIGEII